MTIKERYETLKEVVKSKSLWTRAKRMAIMPFAVALGIVPTVVIGNFAEPLGLGAGSFLGTAIAFCLSTMVLIMIDHTHNQSKKIVRAVDFFKDKTFKDYLFQYVNRVENTKHETNAIELKEGYIAKVTKETVSLETEGVTYDLRYQVGNLISKGIFEHIYAQCQLNFDSNQSLLSNVQAILTEFKSYKTSQDIHFYRLSQMTIKTDLSALDKMKCTETDMIEYMCYLYIRTNITETFTMRNQVNTFLAERVSSKTDVTESDESELNQALLSLKDDESVGEYASRYKGMTVNSLNEFILNLWG